MSRKTILILLLPILAVSLPVLLAVASRSEPERTGGGAPQAIRAPNAPELSPKAVVDQATYDFGIMDPLQEGAHGFTIHNRGRKPLELTAGSTTCKCTLSEITRPIIPPGESGQVRLVWNTGSEYTYYAHGATIHTNDPSRGTLDLRIQGTVRVRFGAASPELLLDGIEPDSPASISTWLYSQIWEAFTVEQVDCSRDDVRWHIEPADPAEAPELKAKSVCRITVTMPAGMPEGYFNDVLTCRVRTDRGDVESLELTLAGKVLRRLSLYGPGIDHLGELDLGNIPQGQGLHRRLVMKVRDPQPELSIRGIEVTPEFMEVELSPYATESQATGLYHLDVRVPAATPSADYRGVRKGRIKLLVDHPRIGDLELPLSFAVLGGK